MKKSTDFDTLTWLEKNLKPVHPKPFHTWVCSPVPYSPLWKSLPEYRREASLYTSGTSPTMWVDLKDKLHVEQGLYDKFDRMLEFVDQEGKPLDLYKLSTESSLKPFFDWQPVTGTLIPECKYWAAFVSKEEYGTVYFLPGCVANKDEYSLKDSYGDFVVLSGYDTPDITTMRVYSAGEFALLFRLMNGFSQCINPATKYNLHKPDSMLPKQTILEKRVTAVQDYLRNGVARPRVRGEISLPTKGQCGLHALSLAISEENRHSLRAADIGDYIKYQMSSVCNALHAFDCDDSLGFSMKNIACAYEIDYSWYADTKGLGEPWEALAKAYPNGIVHRLWATMTYMADTPLGVIKFRNTITVPYVVDKDETWVKEGMYRGIQDKWEFFVKGEWRIMMVSGISKITSLTYSLLRDMAYEWYDVGRQNGAIMRFGERSDLEKAMLWEIVEASRKEIGTIAIPKKKSATKGV